MDKKRADRDKNFVVYKNSIALNVNEIPNEYLQDPPLNIVGPALEASKYYIEESAIREMFAKLIASSMDNRKNKRVHNSYVEIIKQLSPLDAQNLLILKVGEKPIVRYLLTDSRKINFTVKNTNVFLSNEKNTDIESNAISMSNLSRLGLVIVSYTESIANESLYSQFENTEEYKNIIGNVEKQKEMFESKQFFNMPKEIQDMLKPIVSLNSVRVEKGRVFLTPLGESFTSICC